MSLTAIVPIYNEENTIKELLLNLSRIECVNKIIAIDDNSQDATKQILKELEIDKLDIIFNSQNYGKGYTIRQALEIINTDYTIIQDADLELDVTDIEKIYNKITKENLDVVFGSRFLNKNNIENYPKSFMYANKLFVFLTNIFTGRNFTDVLTAYKCTKTENFIKLDTKENHFGFDVEFSFKVGVSNFLTHDIPVSFFPRTKEEGKKINIYDAINLLYVLIRLKIIHFFSFSEKPESR